MKSSNRESKKIIEVDKFASQTYSFVKLFLLTQFEAGYKLPTINKTFISAIFKIIGKRSSARGRPVKSTQSKIQSFYDETFSSLYPIQPASEHLSHVLPLLAEEIVRCLDTNLKTHFIIYLYKYVNITHLYAQLKSINSSNQSKDKKKEARKELSKNVRQVKSDLIAGKINKAGREYHSWIRETLELLFDFKIDKSVAYNIKSAPQRFIRAAFIINRKIEESGYRAYQIVPQRTRLIPRNVTLDTSGILQVINDTDKQIFAFKYTEMQSHVQKYQKHTWKEVLKIIYI